jgi:hypothetical protein
MLNDVVLAFVLEAKTTKNNEAELGILITDYRANLINKHINFKFSIDELRSRGEQKTEDVLIIVVSLRKRLVSCFCSQIFFFHSLFSLFLAVLNLQFWTSGHHFAVDSVISTFVDQFQTNILLLNLQFFQSSLIQSR